MVVLFTGFWSISLRLINTLLHICSGLLALAFALYLNGLAVRPASAAPEPGAQATITATVLQMRTGPGAHYPAFLQTQAGVVFTATGRNADCAWLQVSTLAGNPAWISTEFATLDQPCSQLPIVTPAVGAQPLPFTPLVSAAPVPLSAAPAAPPAVAQPPVAAPATTAPPSELQSACAPLPGADYGVLAVDSAPTDRPAAGHPDLNLAVRGYKPIDAPAALQSFGPVHDVDQAAPQLRALFGDQRHAGVNAVYHVFDWDWGCNCRGGLLDHPAATLAGLAVSPGETLYTPDSPRTIGEGYEALVLYAASSQLTLKFTREDNVISGYTLHVDGVCVDPPLLALYDRLNQAGRGQLPALRGGQPFATAVGDTIQVAIRDNGQFLDPRYLENWWR
jgi:hypothetical protein